MLLACFLAGASSLCKGKSVNLKQINSNFKCQVFALNSVQRSSALFVCRAENRTRHEPKRSSENKHIRSLPCFECLQPPEMEHFGRVILDLGSENTTSFKGRCQFLMQTIFERNERNKNVRPGRIPLVT